MNKKEFREHCKRQIEHCIKFHDEKHLKEHELSLALLKECETRKKEKENFIKFLEDKIKDCDYFVGATIHNFEDLKLSTLSSKKMKELLKTNKLVKEIYEEILERVKSGKYE